VPIAADPKAVALEVLVPALPAGKVDGVGETSTPTNGGQAAALGQAPPTKPVEAPEMLGSAKEAFLAEAAKKGWNIKHGPTIYRLMQELLAEGDQKPSWKAMAEIPTNDWRIAYRRLWERYPQGKPAVAETASVKSPQELDARPEKQVSPVADVVETAPLPEEAPPDSTDSLRSEGERAEDEQMKDPAFLLALGAELERLWKKPESVIKSNKAGPWFVQREILVDLGFKEADGKSTPMALFDCKAHPDRNLTPMQVYALATAVKRLTRELSMKR